MTLTVRSFFSQRGLLFAIIAAAMLAPAVYAADAATDDPAAQAATFEKQAADLRASADRHEKIAKMHRAGAGPSKMQHESIARHCERIAKNLREAAKESDALTASYRSLAEKR